jgi:hypothetical protein
MDWAPVCGAGARGAGAAGAPATLAILAALVGGYIAYEAMPFAQARARIRHVG